MVAGVNLKTALHTRGSEIITLENSCSAVLIDRAS